MNRLQGLEKRFRSAYREARRERYVKYRGSVLPPKHLRLCTQEYKDDEYFLRSAEFEADRLVNRLGGRKDSRILEIGCGAGRLPIGILRRIGEVEYYGLDVLRDRIEWCDRYIARAHPSFHFAHLDVYSERYNRSGKPIDGAFRFGFPDDRFDIVYMFGVIPHLIEEHARSYLREIHRMVKPSGIAFVTAYVEEGAPKVTVNPQGYHGFELSGPLHIVLYERNYFRSMIEESGLKIKQMESMGKEFHDWQTVFYLAK